MFQNLPTFKMLVFQTICYNVQHLRIFCKQSVYVRGPTTFNRVFVTHVLGWRKESGKKRKIN